MSEQILSYQDEVLWGEEKAIEEVVWDRGMGSSGLPQDGRRAQRSQSSFPDPSRVA